MTGEQFRAWRKRHGLNQIEAGLRLGVSRRTIQNYETGEQPVPPAVALATAALELGVADYDGAPLELRAGPLKIAKVERMK